MEAKVEVEVEVAVVVEEQFGGQVLEVDFLLRHLTYLILRHRYLVAVNGLLVEEVVHLDHLSEKIRRHIV